MMQYKVPFNSELIQKFGATINSWIKTGINKRLENQHLTSLRDWLLPMLMNGQVNVHENKQASPAMAADEAGRYRTAKNDTNLKSK
jgi:type I restriction enzyme S subunit